jgi:hypothetical protein
VYAYNECTSDVRTTYLYCSNTHCNVQSGGVPYAMLLLGFSGWPALAWRLRFSSDRPSAHIMVLGEVPQVETRAQLDLPHIGRLDHVAVILGE